MNTQQRMTLTCAIATVLAGSSALAVDAPIPPTIAPEAARERVLPLQHAKPVAQPPAARSEPELPITAPATVGFGARSDFTAPATVIPNATTLSPPVTITYAGTSPILTINNTGTNRSVDAITINNKNTNSALFGQTNGSGAGVNGYNNGIKGPGGKFGVTNAASAQPGMTAATNGTGYALLATITTASSEMPAILGQNQVTSGYGTGVEGEGNDYGVLGYSAYAGVYGNGTEVGTWGYSSAGYGLYGDSSSGIGVYGYSGTSYGAYFTSGSGIGLYSYSTSDKAISAETYSGTAVYANNDSSGYGVMAHSASGIGIYSSSDSYYGIWGQSNNAYAIIGEDSGSGVGIYGSSGTGYAGLFGGKVAATSFVTTSDRNAKTKIHAIDNKTILDKVSNLPVTSWVFKSDPEKSHVGPMAQDFHAAFGLDGDDDKHINLTDIAGVSIAAIQELNKEMKQQNESVAAQLASKDAEIAVLKEQLSSMNAAFSARMTALEQQQQKMGSATQTVSLKKEAGSHGE